MIGHLLGAAGAVEGVATVLALREQTAPPTAGHTEPDPRCGLDPFPGTARPMPMDVALSNNFAFAGANATIAFCRPGRPAPPPTRPPADEVVITGVGALTPAGHCHRTESGLRLSYLDTDPADCGSARQARRLDRLSLFAVVACRRALHHANLDIGPDNGDRVGVILGTGLGPAESLERFAVPVLDRGASAANPVVFPTPSTTPPPARWPRCWAPADPPPR